MKRSYPRLRVDVLCPTLISALSAAAIFPAILPASPLSVMNAQEKGGRTTPTPTPTPPKPVSSKTSPKKPAPATAAKRSRPKSSGPSGNQTSNALTELAFWQTIKDSTNSEDFSAYLQKYPNGKFAALANNRLKALEAGKSSTNPSSTNPNPTSANPSSTNPSTTNSSLSNLPRTRTNQTGIEFVLIPAGSFMMGSTNHGADEKPVHQVAINYSFYMGKYEVTQAQWQSVMGNNPSYFKDCANCPVEQVSWDDAQNFINKLNASNDGFRYRLPTEAEWEYACRAGTTTEFAFGDSLSSDDQANFDPYGGAAKGVYREKTTSVGSFQPNAFGLFDMHGNVWEWCEDWYHSSYAGAPSDGSAWLSGGEQKYRVLRGGSWDSGALGLRSAFRSVSTPAFRFSRFGFRVVAVARTQ
jgi:formylglycine-generating enzyme required for sulfatase activity